MLSLFRFPDPLPEPYRPDHILHIPLFLRIQTLFDDEFGICSELRELHEMHGGIPIPMRRNVFHDIWRFSEALQSAPVLDEAKRAGKRLHEKAFELYLEHGLVEDNAFWAAQLAEAEALSAPSAPEPKESMLFVVFAFLLTAIGGGSLVCWLMCFLYHFP